MWMKESGDGTSKVAVTVPALALLAILIIMVTGHGSPPVDEVTVGNKNFTEQYIVGGLMKQLLEDRGFRVKLASDLSTGQLRAGMEASEIDICANYAGMAWMVLLARQREPGRDNKES